MLNKKISGYLLVLTSMLIVSADSLLVELTQAASWDLLFWRGGFMALSLSVVLLLRSPKKLLSNVRELNVSSFVAGIGFAVGAIGFVMALDKTTVSSTVTIFNTAPLFTVILSFFFLKERIARSTLIAIATVISGVWVIFAFAPSQSLWQGDLYALIGAIFFAIYLICLSINKGRNAELILLIAGIIIMIFAGFNGASPLQLNMQQYIYLFLMGGVMLPAAYLLVSKASALISAPEVSFILLGEIFFGPLYVLFILGDAPSNSDMVGAAIVLTTLAAHTYWQFKHPEPTQG
ncbi:hypothetical protein GCM10007916_09880 [Psychromonas marina]|uniref:EamA domain-containing protein n=1 Tax=Psychromonas marina TaxID=88364 RepID=A0ABQ6DXP2_9GAMM|nr:DMT family transporter [Psychromonas marina]GLS89921.1 hypothetical protein GCM10007916_09880 [Psychromonas marina]